MRKYHWAKAVITVLAGALFGFGLALSTMIQPEVVLSFLHFADWGLMLVMGGAVAITLLTYKIAPRILKKPLLAEKFDTHASSWNRNTLIGSALFGMGWGICGVCPGPAIAALGAGNVQMLWALVGIALGALLQGWLAGKTMDS